MLFVGVFFTHGYMQMRRCGVMNPVTALRLNQASGYRFKSNTLSA